MSRQIIGAVAGAALIVGGIVALAYGQGWGAGLITSGIGLLGTSATALGTDARKPRSFVPDFATSAQDRTHVVRSSVASHKVVYGTARVSGPLTMAEVSGSDNRFLHLIVALAGHELDDVTDLIIDDITMAWGTDIDDVTGVAVSSEGRFAQSGNSLDKNGPLVRAFKHFGADNQAADPRAVSEVANWTSAHRLRGIAYVYVRLQYNKTAFRGGIPDVSAIVRGRRVWDPRDSSQDQTDPSTWVFSNNWALCVLDYIMADFGLGAALDEIDLESFIAAANISDEDVETDSESPAATQKRYTCDGVVDTADKPIEIMSDLLSAGAGDLVYSQGKYSLFAGAYVAPVVTLTADDLAGPVSLQTRVERKALFNAVRGTFVDPAENYNPTDFPPRENASYEAQDGGVQIWRDVELPFTQDSIRAQRIAEIQLRRSRQGITVNFPAKLSAMSLAVGDSVAVTLDSAGADFGWNAKVFRILSWAFTQNGGIDLTLQEEDPSSYDWDAGTALVHDPAPDTNLPDPFAVAAPTGITLASGSAQLFVAGDGTVVSRIKVTWDAVADIFVSQGGEIEVQYRDSALGGSPLDWDDGNTDVVIVPGNRTEAFLGPVQDGVTYDLRVRAINQIGVPSDDDADDWVNSFNHFVIGKTEPPATPDRLLVDRLADGTRRYRFGLDNEPLDLKGFLIRYFLGSTSDWDAMTPLHGGVLTDSPYESNELAAGTYSFACKAVDTTGNLSTTPIFAQAAIGNPRLRNVLVSRLEHDLGFPGTITNGFVDANGVLFGLAAAGTWDQLTSAWDSYTQPWFKLFSPDEPLQYETPEIDLGSEVSFTPLVSIEGNGNYTVEMRSGGDGSPQIETVYAPLAPVVGVRYIQFRIGAMSSLSPQELSSISSLTILLDGEVVIDDVENLATSGADSDFFERIAAGHFRIGTRKSLASISQASITAIQNVGPGYSWELISKDARTGLASPQGVLAAEFKLYDGSGSLADATIDVTLKGPKSS